MLPPNARCVPGPRSSPEAQKPPSVPVRILGLYCPRAPWQPALLPGFPKSLAICLRFSDASCPRTWGLRQVAGAGRVGCSRGRSHPTAGWGEAAQTGTPRTWPPALSPRCFQVSICPHLRKSSVSRTQGCSCGCLGASSLAGFSPLVWASLSSSWSPGPPASLSPLPAFLRYSLGGDPSPVLEGSLSPAGVPAPAPAPAFQTPAGKRRKCLSHLAVRPSSPWPGVGGGGEWGQPCFTDGETDMKSFPYPGIYS